MPPSLDNYAPEQLTLLDLAGKEPVFAELLGITLPKRCPNCESDINQYEPWVIYRASVGGPYYPPQGNDVGEFAYAHDSVDLAFITDIQCGDCGLDLPPSFFPELKEVMSDELKAKFEEENRATTNPS